VRKRGVEIQTFVLLEQVQPNGGTYYDYSTIVPNNVFRNYWIGVGKGWLIQGRFVADRNQPPASIRYGKHDFNNLGTARAWVAVPNGGNSVGDVGAFSVLGAGWVEQDAATGRLRYVRAPSASPQTIRYGYFAFDQFTNPGTLVPYAGSSNVAGTPIELGAGWLDYDGQQLSFTPNQNQRARQACQGWHAFAAGGFGSQPVISYTTPNGGNSPGGPTYGRLGFGWIALRNGNFEFLSNGASSATAACGQAQ
jgi:hypothetical protein